MTSTAIKSWLGRKLLDALNWAERQHFKYRQHEYTDTQWACVCCGGKPRQWRIENE